MLSKKILIVDDEADARQLIRQYIGEMAGMEIVAECSNGLEAVSAIDQYEPDLVFMDIQMPGLSGFQVLQQIVHVPRIIFSTAFDRYALKAFEHNAVDYLLKPYTRERFQQAVNKLLLNDAQHKRQLQQLTEHLQKDSPYPARLLVEQGNKMIGLPVADIQWVEARGDYSGLHTGQQMFLSNLGISALEHKLDPAIFLRIHRSVMVNVHHIREVHREASGPQIVLSNGSVHKVSRSYTDALKKLMV